MRRRTGKTTRMVDQAIQELFRYGRIRIPNQSDILNSVHITNMAPQYTYVIIDPDYIEDTHIQQDLFKKIVKRLDNEHKVNLSVDFKNNIITLNETRS